MNIFADIETLPTNDPAIIADFMAEAEEEKKAVKAPSNYKDEAKISEYISAKIADIDASMADRIHKTGFSGMYGRIACACWAFDDGEVFATDASDTERQAIERFYDSVTDAIKRPRHDAEYSVDYSFVGHNLAAFDLPFIKHRSIIIGITPPQEIRKAFAAKPLDSIIQDTMLMWSSDREKRVSMDKLCRVLGIHGKGDFDGSMVAATWPTDPNKVIEYCKDDVRRTREIYNRLTFNFSDDCSGLPTGRRHGSGL